VLATDWPSMPLDWPIAWIIGMKSLTPAEKDATLGTKLERGSASEPSGRALPSAAGSAASARLGPIMAMSRGAATAVMLLVLLLTTALTLVLGAASVWPPGASRGSEHVPRRLAVRSHS